MTSVIVPTYNEAGNVALLLERLRVALDGTCYEIVLVDDDSPDQTWRLAQLEAASDNRISVIRRRQDRGLSSAILAGMAQARGDVIVVIDADLQHDERCIPDLVSGIVEGGSDLSVASRSVAGGDYGSFSRRRRLISWIGATLARLLLNVPISDPMSGFFALSRERFELLSNDIDPKGFKILLEFLARGPKPSVTEVGYRFGERHSGETKLNSIVVVDYLKAVLTLALHRLGQRRRPTTE
ncbi:MAG: polyprenol monophosphomannose synthase [Acidimicrobiales bacterium]